MTGKTVRTGTLEPKGGNMKKGIMYLTILVFGSVVWGTAYADVLLIAHKSVPEKVLSEKEVRQIFMRKKMKWADNSVIKPAVLEDTEIHDAFLEQHVGRSRSKWRAYWKKMVFTGRGLPPKTFESQKELVRYVAETPGAVGYINSRTSHKNVTVISVK
ncbi:hypothetical protein [Desulfonema magnum]|uniref:hypothetical protein n=1 Tax=Desulfonema magnum TaxID=45655 RepID=UPI001A9B7AC8|nr:hypothetical protein [Desulfonema magnum]